MGSRISALQPVGSGVAAASQMASQLLFTSSPCAVTKPSNRDPFGLTANT